ncbi:MAG: TetR/AcrR family transcriptional regulator [Betaproteobacteria bacterium]|nr:MAG: TetR/AcrR family transcriptional regulator [Betaproteobacteria bacterium]
MKIMTRSYQLKQRAEDQARTRQRIVDATVELHQARGIAATSVADVAARAGVGKATVYRHFPDEAALLGACSGQYFERHPFPDPEKWRAIADPRERLRYALRETYAYHRETEPMIARVLPEIGDGPIAAPYHAHWRRMVEVLVEAWPAAKRDTPVLTAALALALDFGTWRLLVRDQRLAEEAAIGLMLHLFPATC